MGAYLSEPITDKISTDEEGQRVICGASSMQGWRVTQEDAHNCTLEYDEKTSFFAVYDGHGGHEVAAYSAQHLPQYLKKCEAYKNGDYVQALKDAFLEFDATLTKPEVVTILKHIASKKEGDENSGSDEEEEENVRNLFEEAEMPLEQVMAKYHNDLVNPNAKKIKQEDGKPPVSPFLRGRRSCTSGASSSASSSGYASSSKCSTSSKSGSGNGSTDPDEEAAPVAVKKDRDSEVSSSSSQGYCSKSRQHEASSNGDSEPEKTDCDEVETEKGKATMPDSSGDAKKQNVSDKVDAKQEVNGELGDGVKTVKDSEGVTSSSAPHENGEVAESEGKGKSPSSSVVEEKKRAKLRPYSGTSLYSTLLGGLDQSDSDSDDEEGDESFQGADNSSDDDDDDDDDDDNEDEDDGEEGDADETNENEEDEDEEDEDSMLDDEEDEDEDFTMKMTEEPGSDSGCTAVVALLKGQELYVANAGDSRCIVCRKGQAIEMSLDHKPEDETEMKRIVNAGGRVTADGRVNGGLNLSRALGDHAYKQSEGLPAEEQMITALPDVRTLMIDPAEDEFMVLACDGIWNFMSSQEVVDFVRPRVQEGDAKLSQICEELFDHCLAPNTLGDGTGCDNMTAVIVQFRPELANQTESKSLKRAASPSSDTAKRPKMEETETATSV